jgi:hypothetical protein
VQELRPSGSTPVEALENLINEEIAERAADISVLLRDPEIQGRLRAPGVDTDALNEKLEASEPRFAAISPEEPFGIEAADPNVLRSIARRFSKAGVRARPPDEEYRERQAETPAPAKTG